MSHRLPERWEFVASIDDTKFFANFSGEKILSFDRECGVQSYTLENEYTGETTVVNTPEVIDGELHFELLLLDKHNMPIMECSITPNEPGIDILSVYDYWS